MTFFLYKRHFFIIICKTTLKNAENKNESYFNKTIISLKKIKNLIITKTIGKKI